MATYVFLTSQFMPSADASGICVYNISKELIKKGHKVYVICEGINEELRFFEDIEIYEVKPVLYTFLRLKVQQTKSKKDIYLRDIVGIFRKFAKAFTFFMFPNVAYIRSLKEYKILKQINKKEKIDFIIGTFRPFEGIASATRFKKANPNVKSILIFWDLLRTPNPFGEHLYKLFDFLCNKAEKNMFTKITLI